MAATLTNATSIAGLEDLRMVLSTSSTHSGINKDAPLGGDLSMGARGVVYHKNEMGGSFVLESVQYALDGAPIFTKVDVDGQAVVNPGD